jgi:hypothetical protein
VQVARNPGGERSWRPKGADEICDEGPDVSDAFA